jgi:hypothetical protein
MTRNSEDPIAKQIAEAAKPTSYLSSQYVVWHLQQALPLLQTEDRRFVEDLIAAWSGDSTNWQEVDNLVGVGIALNRKAQKARDGFYLTLPQEIRDHAHRQRTSAVEGAMWIADALRTLAAIQLWIEKESRARSIRASNMRLTKRRECLREVRRLMQEADMAASSGCHGVAIALKSWSFTKTHEAALADPAIITGKRTPYMDDRSDAEDFAHRVSEGTYRHFMLLEELSRNGRLFEKDFDQLMTALNFGATLAGRDSK